MNQELQYHIGGKVRRMRLRRATSVERMALESKVSATVIHKIEKGRTNPTAETLWKLSEYFACDVQEFFRGFGLGSMDGWRCPGCGSRFKDLARHVEMSKNCQYEVNYLAGEGHDKAVAIREAIA